MAKGCGRWFMQKADLTVHAATHDVKTSLFNLCKYWKEHMKGHEVVLPYECSICKEYFLYRQQVA